MSKGGGIISVQINLFITTPNFLYIPNSKN